MQNRLRIVVAAVVLFCSAIFSTAFAAGNLAVNGSFEEGADGNVSGWNFWNWAAAGGATTHGTWDDKVAHSGTHSLKFDGGTDKKHVGIWENIKGGAFFPVEAGKRYTFSMWVKTQTKTGDGYLAKVDVRYLDAEKTTIPNSVSSHSMNRAGETDWKQVRFNERAPQNAKFMGVQFYFSGMGAAWIDDVELQELDAVAVVQYPRVEPGAAYLVCAKTDAPPAMNGKLDAPCWRRAVELAPFVFMAGNGQPNEQSRAYLLYDDKNLYIGVECQEPCLDPVLQKLHEVKSEAKAGDAAVTKDECVELFIQPKPDSTEYFHLAVNPKGALYGAQSEKGQEKAWNTAVKVATSADTKSWIAEFAIPLTDLNAKPAPGQTWRFNVARHRSANGDNSAWAPTGTSFGVPEKFGLVRFAESAPVAGGVVLPEFIEGTRKLALRIGNSSPKDKTFVVSMNTQYDQGDPVSYSSEVSLAGNRDSDETVPYILATANQCFVMDATPARAGKTFTFRTAKYFKVQPGLKYRLSAMVKAQDLTNGQRPMAISLNVVDAAHKDLGKYQDQLRLKPGTYDWTRQEVVWEAPEEAAEVMLWAVKWAGAGVTGKAWVDDLRLTCGGASSNFVPNGGIERDSNGVLAGWETEVPLAESYPRSGAVKSFFQVSSPDGEVFYSSPFFAGELKKRVTVINSAFILKATLPSSSRMYRFDELYSAAGGYIYIPTVFRSAKVKELDGCQLILDVPEFLKLIDPAPRATLAGTERVMRNGIPFTRYTLKFAPKCISPAEAVKESTVINQLMLQCDAAPEGVQQSHIYYHATAAGAVEEENEARVVVLGPLQWKRPQTVPILSWGAFGGFFNILTLMNPAERNLVLDTFRLAGHNLVSINGSVTPEEAAARGYGRHGGLSWGFPGSLPAAGVTYLAAHPEGRAVNFSGTTLPNFICPAYFVSPENGYLPEIKKHIAGVARSYALVSWDYEVGTLAKSSTCVCPRCLKAFREEAKLADSVELTPAVILAKYKKEWTDFRCHQTAVMSKLFRETIKESNPNCTYAVYSGYEGTQAQYGIEWRYLPEATDYAMCGYGRSLEMLANTRKAIGARPLNCGELFWFGSDLYDVKVVKTSLFRRLTDGGTGVMVYFDWFANNRMYEAVSCVAAVVADFEPFFLWDKDAQGFFVTRWSRNDSLVRVGGDGTADDAAVLLRGKERLVFLINEKKTARTFEVENVSWETGMSCVDYGTKKVGGAKLAVTVPANDVVVLHVRPQSQEDAVTAPTVISAAEQQKLCRFPLVAWQGTGAHPGDQVYSLEISSSPQFPAGQTTVVADLAASYYIPRQGVTAGTTYSWRVRAKDVVTGKTGPLSEVSSFTVPASPAISAQAAH